MLQLDLQKLNKPLKTLVTVLALVLLVFSQSSRVFAQALPAVDQAAINGGWYQYVDTGIGCVGSSSGSSAPVTKTIGANSNVYILGDSITLRAANVYASTFQAKQITTNIDAVVGRSLTSPGQGSTNGMQAIAQDQAEIKSANAIVVALGTNGGDTTSTITAAIQAIRADNASSPIYWVDTIGVNAPNFDAQTNQATNQAIYTDASTDNYQIISWFKTVDLTGDPLNPTTPEKDPNGYISTVPADLGVHPTTAGITALVNLVVGTLTGALSSSGTASSCCGTSVAGLSGSTNGTQAYNYLI